MWPSLVTRPKFSAIITSHNYKQFVGEAIRSVHTQTYENLECIVIDDASTDGSPKVIEKAIKGLDDPRFRIIKSAKNLGQMGAMLMALGEATGDFVGFLDADDIWTADFVRSHIEAHLNQSRSAGMSSCDMGIIGKDRQLLSGTWLPLEKPRGKQNGRLTEVKPFMRSKAGSDQVEFFPDSDQTFFLEQTKPASWKFSPTSACVFRRDLLNLIAPQRFDGFRISADYYFIMLSSTLTGCLIIEKVCSFYRLHGANAFSNHPVVGGAWLPGKWETGGNKKYNKVIIETIDEKYEQLSSIFGQWRILEAVQKLNHEFSTIELKSIAPKVFKDLYPWKPTKWSLFWR